MEDDGKGFDLKTIEQKNTTAFHALQSRANNLNGQFKIDSEINVGTRILLKFPMIFE